MKKKLQAIADIKTGYSFRKEIEQFSDEGVRVVQMKNIQPGIPVTDDSNLTIASLDSTPVNAALQNGDILLVNRAASSGLFKATLYTGSNSNTIAASSLVVIRLKSKSQINSQYIVEYLNSTTNQTAFFKIARGSAIKSISLQQIREFEITLPDRETQDLMVNLINVNKKQQQLLTQKINLLTSIMTGAIQQL